MVAQGPTDPKGLGLGRLTEKRKPNREGVEQEKRVLSKYS